LGSGPGALPNTGTVQLLISNALDALGRFVEAIGKALEATLDAAAGPAAHFLPGSVGEARRSDLVVFEWPRVICVAGSRRSCRG
jgi:hypothetical protein